MNRSEREIFETQCQLQRDNTAAINRLAQAFEDMASSQRAIALNTPALGVGVVSAVPTITITPGQVAP